MVKPYQSLYRAATQRKNESGSTKDLWDKIAALTVPFVTLVVGLLGAYATFTYNQADLREKIAQAKAALQQQSIEAQKERDLRGQQQADARLLSETQALERLFEFIASPDSQKREFGYAMFAEMGKKELAARLIEIKQDKAGISVLKSLARDKNPEVAAAAVKGLQSLENEIAFSAGGSQVIRQRSSCKEFAENGFRVSRRESTPDDYRQIAQKFGVEPEALAAFMDVEAVDTLRSDGRPKILFERHIFRRLTGGRYDKSNPVVSNPNPGGYKAGGQEYERLQEAASLNCPAALSATSWVGLQILGSQYKYAGYKFVDDFIKDVMGSGPKEIEAAMSLLQSLKVLDALKAKDWDNVARLYNGPSYRVYQYGSKLRAAYVRRTSGNERAPP